MASRPKSLLLPPEPVLTRLYASSMNSTPSIAV